MNNSLKSANDHLTKLSNDQSRMSDKEEKVQDDLILVKSDLDVAEVELQQCEKRFINDEATEQELDSAQAKVKGINEKLAALERLGQLVSEELKRISNDIQVANKDIEICFRDFCLAEKKAISEGLNQDPKIRARLLEAYAAMLSNPQGFNGNWTLFVTSIFTSTPTQIEIDSAIAAFSQKHGLDK